MLQTWNVMGTICVNACVICTVYVQSYVTHQTKVFIISNVHMMRSLQKFALQAIPGIA